MFFLPKKRVIVHNGSFHTDDIFAVASLSLLLAGKIKIIRTRDQKIISKGDYVVDVGGIYDYKTNRFDHHQRGGGGKRENGVSYASFGLVWKHYGEKISGGKEIAEIIDKKLVAPVDAFDNGEGELKEILPSVFPYTINEIIDAFNLSSLEIKNSVKSDKTFKTAVSVAKKLLEREIQWAKVRLEAGEIVKACYEKAVDKRIIVFEEECPFEESIGRYEEPLFVIYQYQDGNWSAKAVRKNSHTFESRVLFPESWAGKRDRELVDASGVPDAVFCHNKRFMAIAKSKGGALALAQKALRG